jgi:tetratricopeptide (TPR) repeat protein
VRRGDARRPARLAWVLSSALAAACLLAAPAARTVGAQGTAGSAPAQRTLADIAALPHHEQKKELDAFLKRTPNSSEARFQLGIWYYEEGQLTEALAAFKKTLALDPSNFKALANADLVLTDLKKNEESLPLFESFIAKNPKDAAAIASYGENLWALDRKAEAMAQYRKALSIDPKCPEAHFNMGTAFAELGIFREAIREWQEVVVIGRPNHLVSQSKENIVRAEGKL